MKRIDLVPLRRTLVTPDTAEGVRQVELRASTIEGARLVLQGPTADQFRWDSVYDDPGPTKCAPATSMRSTGRELQLRLQLPASMGGNATDRRRREIEVLWGLAVPCGFVPWTRYPLPGPGDEVFHFFGPWQVLYDSLCGEGRGEEAWSSLCTAAQVDVGRWGGDREVERFVQAQLHRLGVPCGAVSGVVDDRTLSGLRALGLKGLCLEDVANRLALMDPPRPPKEQRKRGFISVDGNATAVATGKVAVIRTPQGFALAVDGPGRVILDVGGQP